MRFDTVSLNRLSPLVTYDGSNGGNGGGTAEQDT
jgi:hypothetical protein